MATCTLSHLEAVTFDSRAVTFDSKPVTSLVHVIGLGTGGNAGAGIVQKRHREMSDDDSVLMIWCEMLSFSRLDKIYT